MAEEDQDGGLPLPPPATIVWTLEIIRAHPAYPTYLEFMRGENDDDHWNMSEDSDDLETWVEWVLDYEEEASRRLETGGGAAAPAVPMNIDAPREGTRPLSVSSPANRSPLADDRSRLNQGRGAASGGDMIHGGTLASGSPSGHASGSSCGDSVSTRDAAPLDVQMPPARSDFADLPNDEIGDGIAGRRQKQQAIAAMRERVGAEMNTAMNTGVRANLALAKAYNVVHPAPVPVPSATTERSGGASWLCVGARVQYQTSEGKPEPAVIRQVHTDDPTAHYYTILVAATGVERQTPADRLRPLEGAEAATIEGAAPGAEAATKEGAAPRRVGLTVANEAEPTTHALASKDAALKVKAGHVLDVYKDSKTFYGCATVDKVVVKGETVTVELSWDDGDASNRQLVLYDPTHDSTTWPRWQFSSRAKTPLFLRLGKTCADLLRAPSCADAKAPEASVTPTGIFGAVIDCTSLGNSLLANGLGGEPLACPPSSLHTCTPDHDW